MRKKKWYVNRGLSTCGVCVGCKRCENKIQIFHINPNYVHILEISSRHSPYLCRFSLLFLCFFFFIRQQSTGRTIDGQFNDLMIPFICMDGWFIISSMVLPMRMKMDGCDNGAHEIPHINYYVKHFLTESGSDDGLNSFHEHSHFASLK